MVRAGATINPVVKVEAAKCGLLFEMLHHCQQAFYERAPEPVPQENLLFVEQASCLFLRMVQDVSYYPKSNQPLLYLMM